MQILKKNNASRIAFKWSSIFFLIGFGLIYTTDLVLNHNLSDYNFYSTYQTYKEIVFVSIATAIFFLIVRHLLSRITKKNERLLYALKAGNMAAWNFDVDTREVTRSENHHKLYGYQHKPKKWNLSLFLNHVAEENRAEVKDELIKAVEHGDKIDKEFKIKTAGGNSRWRWLRGKVEYDSKNQPKRVSGVLIDIDNRKKTEQKLQREEQFIEVSINSVPGIFFVLNDEGNMIRWNENANKVSGLSDEQLNNLHVIERIEQEDKEKAKEALGKVLTEGEIQTELALKTKEQGKSIYKITASRFQNKGEQFIVGTGIDITELFKKQDKIRRQNYQLQTAQHIAKLGYWENNLATNKLQWTDTIYELFDLDKGTFNLTPENFAELIHPKDRDILSRDSEKLKQTGTFESEYRLIKPNGTIGWFREKGEVFEWQNGEPKIVHGIVMDVTQQKQVEKEIRKSLIKGENRERKRIANELHDGIAQYLSSALLHFDGAENELEKLPESSIKKVRQARRLVKEALTETQTISQNLMPKSIDQNGLASAVKNLVKQYQISTDIHFKYDIENLDHSNQLSNEVEVNVYRIIQELLSNAVRHSNCETIWMQLRKKDQTLICIIRDDGTGTDETGSKGLGLQSVNNRVQLLSGTVQFDNSSNTGLEINITVPIN